MYKQKKDPGNKNLPLDLVNIRGKGAAKILCPGKSGFINFQPQIKAFEKKGRIIFFCFTNIPGKGARIEKGNDCL